MMRRRIGAALAGAILVSVAAHAPFAFGQPAPQPTPKAKIATPRQARPAPSAPVTTGTVAQNTAPPRTAAETQRALVDRASLYLTGITTLVGNFVQIGPDRSRVEGVFYLQKPGRVRFEYNPPSPIELIADGQTVAVRDRKLATQEVLPLAQTPLRLLLAERIDLARDTHVVGASADANFVTIVMEERQAFGGTHRLMLMFSAQDFQLKQWTITDPQGYDTTVAVFNLDTTKKPDPSMFKINYERMLQ